MRVRVIGVVGVATAAAVAAMLGASSAFAEGSPSPFDALRADISGSSLPAVQETSFLERVTLAQNLLSPPGAAFPPSPCSATAQLDSIGFSTQGLLAGRHIDQDDASTLIEDVTRANDAIVFGSDYPPSPCRVAFLGPALGDG